MKGFGELNIGESVHLLEFQKRGLIIRTNYISSRIANVHRIIYSFCQFTLSPV